MAWPIVKTRRKLRFDIEALRDLAGDKVFERGEVYFGDGLVQLLSIEPTRVLAQVEGNEDYRTELTGRGTDVGGKCSCPAFEDWGFCKHMVATALATNAAGCGEVEGMGALPRIRAHLKSKSVDALVEMIVGMAERDSVLFRKLEMAAATTDSDDKTLEARLRKAIDTATRTREYIDYGAARDWAAGVDSVLDTVADLALGDRASIALRLAERALDRIDEASESMDDSDGHCGALLERARDIHFAAARALKPDPVALARDVFAREMTDNTDVFYNAVAIYAEVLGDKGLAEYRRLAMEAWQKLPARSGKAREPDDFSYEDQRLERILDFFYEQDGNIDARIALRTKNLSSPWRYVQLAEFCLSQGRHDEAVRRAEEGLWMFEDGRTDERLVLFAADLLAKSGRKADAEAHLWRIFKKEPSLELYTMLRKLGGEDARKRALKLLEDLTAKEPRKGWRSGGLLIRVLMQEKLLEAAWAAVRSYGASIGLREELARASEKTHAREALEVYAERFEQLAGAGDYTEAVKVIARMAKLRSPAEQADYVAALKLRHARKRNLMKLLG